MPSSACSGQCCPGRSGRGAGAARAPSSPLAASAAPWSQQGPSSASAGDQGGLGRGRGHRRLRGGSGRSDASQPRSGPPSHSPRRAASRTRHGLTARPVKRTCQGVGTGVRWVDRGTGAAGPAWLVVREPRGRPAEAIPRTTRPRSRTRRRPRALFWVGGSFLNKVPLTKNSDQANRPIQVDRRPAPDCIPPGRRGGDGYPSPETRTVDPSCLLCCTRTARLRGGSGHTCSALAGAGAACAHVAGASDRVPAV